jgi:hypothetical protein
MIVKSLLEVDKRNKKCRIWTLQLFLGSIDNTSRVPTLHQRFFYVKNNI